MEQIRTYEDARNWLHNLLKFGIKPGLERMQWMLDKLGNPQQQIPCIHIGGTNGKGSTVTYLRHILNGAGYSVGTFTSPYILTFNERISLNGIPLFDDDFTKLVQQVQPIAEEVARTSFGSPTEFEIITVLSFLYFADKRPDIVIYEVGLGGLYDSTNVISPLVSIITNIGFDHMKVLGDNLVDIARQKAGIIKPGIPIVTAAEQGEVLAVFQEDSQIKESKIYQLGKDFTVSRYKDTEEGQTFSYESRNGSFNNLSIPMKGLHQVKNASLAVKAAEILTNETAFFIADEAVREGLSHAVWPGRFEKINQYPEIIIDGAHNLEGVRAFVDTVSSRYSKKKKWLMFAAIQDKNYEEMLSCLASVFDSAYLTSFSFPSALSAAKLSEESPFHKTYVFEDWKEAFKEKIDQMDREDVLFITGSLYFISEVKNYLKDFPDN